MIPYGRQEVTQDDIDQVVSVLKSDFLTQGPVVPLFESTVARYCGATHGVAVSNATAALHIACLALELGRGNILWTTPITFVASANCGVYCGASIDFVDIDPLTFNISPMALEAKLVAAEKAGRLPKVLVVVHLCGQPCDMRAIHSLGMKYGFKIIEDASHAIGGSYGDTHVGSCRYSDISIFSFHPVKVITTGEGGMAVTNDAMLADRMRLLRSHGITRDSGCMTHEPDGPWYYQQIELGFNYRMTELQAALGISQMERLDAYVSRRHQIASRYGKRLAGLPLTPQQHLPDTYSGMHLYVVRLNADETSRSRREVFEMMRSQGIGVNVHYIPVHTQPFYRALGFSHGDYPEAERYYAQAMSLPIYPGLADEQQDHVIDALVRAVVP